MNGIVTIEDIASKAGVGRGTVDRVIHNRGRVSEEKKKRILECIEELNYKPNKAARMLARKGTYRVAVLYHDAENEFWAQVHSGIKKAQDEYLASGVQINEFVLPYIDIDKQVELIEKIMQEKYDGLAIVPYDSPKVISALNKAIAQGIRVMTFNNGQKEIHAGYIGQNGLQGGRTAGRLMSMIAPSNSKYAVFSAHNRGMALIDERSRGFRDTIDRYREDMSLLDVFCFQEERNVVYQDSVSIFQEYGDKIDAIYVTTAMAGVVAAAVEKSMKDEELKKRPLFIGHDLTEMNVGYMKKGVIDILIGQEPEKQGYQAIDSICRNLLLEEKINQDQYTQISVVLRENLQT